DRPRLRPRHLPARHPAAGARGRHGEGGVSSVAPRVGVVGVPGAWSTEQLAEALTRAGARTTIVDLATCALRLPGLAVHSDGHALELDAAVVKKIGDTADGWSVRERIQILRQLEASGVPVWSSPDRLEAALDRYRMTVELAAAGIPIPETV